MGSWLSGESSYLRDILLPSFHSIILCSGFLWGEKKDIFVSICNFFYLIGLFMPAMAALPQCP